MLGDTTASGYGWDHQQERARWKPTVDRGEAWCTEPICLMRDRWIPPGTPWDLAHNRETGGYRGPAHARCNRSEGARWGNRVRRTTRRAPSAPRRWQL